MAISTQIQNLNLIPGKSAPVVVHLSQGNVGNTVQFYLYDGDNPYYPTNVSIAVHGVRADNTVFGPYTVSVTSGSNLVSFDIVTAMTSVTGAAIGELVLTDSNQNQVGSANFGMLVEETPYSSSVTYEDDLSIYQRILAYVQSFPASVQSQLTSMSQRIDQETAARNTAINTESSRATGVENTLQTDLSAEENARIAADNTINSRIDQIISPSGSAPSAAEVTDARIGYNNVTHSTLGVAIRNQVTSLVNGLGYNFEMVTEPLFTNNGKYVNQNGNTVSNSAWRTTGYITVKGTCLYIKGPFSSLSGAGYNVSLFRSDYSFIKGYVLGVEGEYGAFFDVSGATYIMLSNTTARTFAYGFISTGVEAAIVKGETDILNLSAANYTVTGYLKADGTINSGSTDWVSTDFIPVNHLGLYVSGRWYSLRGVGCNVCVYDRLKHFLRGIACESSEDMRRIDLKDAAYVRFSTHDPYYGGPVYFAMRTESAIRGVTVDINGHGDYTSLLEALISTSDDTPIRLMKGTYDVIEEYKAHYGSDFFDNYQGYSGVSDPFYRGLWMSTGREIHGDPGAVIKCVYTGSNTKVATLFSCIANAGNVLLENVTINHGNLRYAIHDDYGATTGQKIEFRNIRFVGSSNGAPIGAGLGINTTVIIDGCVFEGNRQTWDINYHGSNSAGADNTNRIYVRNCRGSKGCGFWPNGPSTALSTAYVSNCKFGSISLYRPEGQSSSQAMNIELIEWCNEVD